MHKTIICSPSLFDEEFDKWKRKEITKDYSINIKSIKHDGNYHYIFYKYK